MWEKRTDIEAGGRLLVLQVSTVQVPHLSRFRQDLPSLAIPVPPVRRLCAQENTMARLPYTVLRTPSAVHHPPYIIRQGMYPLVSVPARD